MGATDIKMWILYCDAYSLIKFTDVPPFRLNMVTCTKMSNIEAVNPKGSSPCVGTDVHRAAACCVCVYLRVAIYR